jgi:acetyl-CoA C-acetyltransferase
MQSKNVFIAGGMRTPFVKSMGKYQHVTTQELMTEALKKVVEKFGLQNKVIGDVALGAVMNSSSNWNLARECVLGSGLHPYTPGVNISRACGTGLEAAGIIAGKIALGQMETGIAGGVDTNSDLPIMVARSMAQKLLALNYARSFGERLGIILSMRPSDFKPTYPAVVEPRTGLSMGEHCEKMVKEWKISQAEQDKIAFRSHINGEKAYQEGFYKDLVFEFQGLKKDGTLRGDTTLEKLAKLKPVFDRSPTGTMTAGNSTPLTDGASAVVLTSEAGAQGLRLPMLARFVDVQSAGVDFVGGDGLLMAPTIAVARLLERNKLNLQDFDFYEIHEAFAGQVACTLKAWESVDYCRKYMGWDKALGPIDQTKMNIKGGSVAMGHPFAATGGRILAGLAKMLHQKGSGRGLISICTGGGMGVAAIVEAV